MSEILRKAIAITGVSGQLGRALLPILENDPDIQHIIGIDCKPLPSHLESNAKLEFHPVDIRARELPALLQGAHATEESPLHPNGWLCYGRAKAVLENSLLQLAMAYPEMVITRLRPCTIVDPNAPKSQMELLINPYVILVWNYNLPGQLVHEQDVAHAIFLALRKDLPGAYNATSDNLATREELAKMLSGSRLISIPEALIEPLLAAMWRMGFSTFAPEWADLFRYSIVASNAKRKAAGWSPRYSTSEAYRSLLETFGQGSLYSN